MKIPFDIKYRDKIESGEYKVETKAGQTVRIVCWDRMDAHSDYVKKPIVALVLWNDKIQESVFNYTKEGKSLSQGQDDDHDLFLVTPEEELTEFEQAVKTWMGVAEDIHIDNSWVRNCAKELFEIARKELTAKDLPRWEKGHIPFGEIALRQIGIAHCGYDVVRGGFEGTMPTIRYILVSELEKLPKNK